MTIKQFTNRPAVTLQFRAHSEYPGEIGCWVKVNAKKKTLTSEVRVSGAGVWPPDQYAKFSTLAAEYASAARATDATRIVEFTAALLQNDAWPRLHLCGGRIGEVSNRCL